MKKTHVAISPLATLAILLLVAILLSTGCAKRESQNGASSTVKQTTATTVPTTPTTSSTVEQTELTLYFTKDFKQTMFLVAEHRNVPKTQAIAKAVVEQLIKGPRQDELISFIPRNTRLLSLKVANGLATVDFSREVLNASAGAEGEELGIYQIVNTLTEFPTIKSVRFTVEGRDKGMVGGRAVEDWWGHIGLREQPFTRNEETIQGGKIETNTIRIESPRAFTVIDNPVEVKGTVQVFEATFQVRVLDMDDKILADKQLMASDFYWGTFDERIIFTPPGKTGRGTVLFYYYSPKDGSEVRLGSVPVFFDSRD